MSTVRGEAGRNGNFAVLTMTRKTVSGRSTTLSGGRCGGGLTGDGCPSMSCRITSHVDRELNLRIEITIPKRARQNNDPYPCSEILYAHLNSTTTGTVVSRSCNYVVTVMGKRAGEIPLTSMTKGLGAMSPGDRVVGRTGHANVYFKSWTTVLSVEGIGEHILSNPVPWIPSAKI